MTHEHTDHTRGLEVFTRSREVAVYSSQGTRDAAALDGLDTSVGTLEAGRTYDVGGFRVTPFRTSHDAEEPVGYRIETSGGEVVGIATDTGVLTAEAATRSSAATCSASRATTTCGCSRPGRTPTS